MDNKQLRQTAFIIRISDLKGGRYIKEEGWEPNYILTKKLKVNRANIMGVVISKSDSPDTSFKNLVLDDGSESINVRNFDDNKIFDGISVGDAVIVVGRPREYGSEKYLLPEIIKKIGNSGWLKYRKRELDLFNIKNADVFDVEPLIKEELQEEVIQEESIKENSSDRVIKFIKDNDSGEGVDIENIITSVGCSDCESLIQFLLKNGEIFELKPGKVKVLE